MFVSLGVEKGDRVVIYMPMIPETLFAMLACARLGAVHSVVFGGFAPLELAKRIDDATPKLLLTTSCGIEGARTIAYKPMVDEALTLATQAVDHVLLFQRERVTAEMSAPRDIDWASGAMLFLRRSALTSVGGWDERYFMYMEDVDLCWRLRRLGWRVAYEPGGRAIHVQGASTARTPYRMIAEHHRSAFRFAERRWRGPRRLLLVPAAVFLAGRAAVEIAARALGSRPGRPRVSG